MTEIRYWDVGNDLRGSAAREQTKKAREAVDRFDRSFRSELLGQLSMMDGDSLMSGSSSGLTSGMFGQNGPQLMDLDIDGIEKVWAAQMESPLNYFSGFNNTSNNSDSTGLAGVVDLMVKEQIAKARKQLEQQQSNYSIDEFVKEVSGSDQVAAGLTNETETLTDFLATIDRQIKDASSRFGVSASDIRKQLLEM